MTWRKITQGEHVHQIAKFMRVDCSEEVLARVVHTTTHGEMAKQSSKFTFAK